MYVSVRDKKKKKLKKIEGYLFESFMPLSFYCLDAKVKNRDGSIYRPVHIFHSLI